MGGEWIEITLGGTSWGLELWRNAPPARDPNATRLWRNRPAAEPTDDEPPTFYNADGGSITLAGETVMTFNAWNGRFETAGGAHFYPVSFDGRTLVLQRD